MDEQERRELFLKAESIWTSAGESLVYFESNFTIANQINLGDNYSVLK